MTSKAVTIKFETRFKRPEPGYFGNLIKSTFLASLNYQTTATEKVAYRERFGRLSS